MLFRPVQPMKASFPILVTELGMTVAAQPIIKLFASVSMVFVSVSMMALQLSRESYVLFPSDTSMLVRPMQPSKEPLPIFVTDLGMTMLVRLTKFTKALLPISVTESGIIVLAQPAINLFVSVSMMALQLLRESYVLFPSDTIILVRLEQPVKAQEPIFVTRSGMTMLFKSVQPLKASIPILVTESGMTMLVRLLRPLKASPPISVTESGMTVVAQPTTNLFASVSIIALQLSRESYFLFPSDTLMLVKEQPLNILNIDNQSLMF